MEWIDKLEDTEVVAELKKFGLPSEGQFPELRENLRSLVTKVSESFVAHSNTHTSTPKKSQPEEAENDTSVEHQDPEKTTTKEDDPVTVVSTDRPRNHVGEIVRKWNISLDEKGDPVAFLERVQELQESYGFSNQQFLTAVPELLKGSVLLWCRNNRPLWKQWSDFEEDFKSYYWPADYQLRLEEEISQRIQKSADPDAPIWALFNRATTASALSKPSSSVSSVHPPERCLRCS